MRVLCFAHCFTQSAWTFINPKAFFFSPSVFLLKKQLLIWEIFPYNHPMDNKTTPLHNPRLSEVMAVAQPLVQWMVKSGIGYNEFAQALKPLFLSMAEQELEALGQKASDSSISLLSGLHRKDVRAFRQAAKAHTQSIQHNLSQWSKPSAANQVFTRWLSSSWPQAIPFQGESDSFEALAQSVSKDVHPRAMLQEMTRLNLAHEIKGFVHLIKDGFIPDTHERQARELLSASVADHLCAGVHNLHTTGQPKFLEQSVFANELSKDSIDQLHALSQRLWEQVLKDVVQAASVLCEKDTGCADPHRFRLGLFAFDAPEIPSPPTGDPHE